MMIFTTIYHKKYNTSDIWEHRPEQIYIRL